MKVEKVRDARNLAVGKEGRGNTEILPADEPCASSWQAQDREGRNYIYPDQQNMMCYERYGGRNYSYDPCRDYYITEWPQINSTPTASSKMEISQPNPNHSFMQPLGFGKGKCRTERKIDDRHKRNGESHWMPTTTKIRIDHGQRRGPHPQ